MSVEPTDIETAAPDDSILAEEQAHLSEIYAKLLAMRDELAGTDMQEYIPAPFRSTGKKEETK